MVTIRLVCSLWLLSIGGYVWASEEASVDDICLNAYSKGGYGTREGYELLVQEPNKHVSTRLMRYFWFGGVLQAISESWDMSRELIVRGGVNKLVYLRSVARRNSERTVNVLHLGFIHPVVDVWDESLYRALVNYLSGTENEVQDPSVWRDDGHRQINRYQGEKLSKLAAVDFNGTLDKNNLHHVEGLLVEFRELVDKYVHNSDFKENVVKVVEEELIPVFCINPSMLFEEGKAGYNMMKSGSFVKRYFYIDAEEDKALLLKWDTIRFKYIPY